MEGSFLRVRGYDGHRWGFHVLLLRQKVGEAVRADRVAPRRHVGVYTHARRTVRGAHPAARSTQPCMFIETHTKRQTTQPGYCRD